jgi:vacuolar protein sorting-associated protein VTA1
VLETLKTEFGQHDVIINDAASAAYVENFAFKIFANADNEDRSGKTTKGTAKKFLAAATFLELLKTFDDTQLSESVSDCTHFIARGSTE